MVTADIKSIDAAAAHADDLLDPDISGSRTAGMNSSSFVSGRGIGPAARPKTLFAKEIIS